MGRITAAIDRAIMDLHRGDDLTEGLEGLDIELDPSVICVWCKQPWPCDKWQAANARASSRSAPR